MKTKSLVLLLPLSIGIIASAQAVAEEKYVPVGDYFSMIKASVPADTLCSYPDREIKEVSQITEMVSHARPFMRPMFPVKGAFRIVVAEVKKTTVRLNGIRSGVYVDFDLKVEEVLKEAPGTAGESKMIACGGGVRFDSGKVQRYHSSGYEYPRNGKRYVFFITASDSERHMTTGFELTDNKIVTLSAIGAQKVPEDSPLFSYEKMSVKDFLTALRKEISKE